jgi:hypothetical protein
MILLFLENLITKQVDASLCYLPAVFGSKGGPVSFSVNTQKETSWTIRREGQGNYWEAELSVLRIRNLVF